MPKTHKMLVSVEHNGLSTNEEIIELLNNHFSPDARFSLPSLREGVSGHEATQEKGYPHPGSVIQMPDNGGAIHLQYGHPQEVGRNGCFMHDVLQRIIDHLSVYQQEGHPLSSIETDDALQHLVEAKECILSRRRDRKARGVHNTDKP